MKTSTAPFLFLAVVVMSCRADAQGIDPGAAANNVGALVLTNTQEFSFTADTSYKQTKQQNYCLQDPKNLIKVLSVKAETSDATSSVNVRGDIESNCIDLSVELPPAKQICTDVPSPTFIKPDNKRQFCTVIPTTLKFTVTYESRVNVDKVLSDTIYQIGNLMDSASSGCAGGEHGQPPINWSSLQSHGNAALTALRAAKSAWAGNQTSNAVQQINSAQGELEVLINGLSMSCPGGSRGRDPFSYGAYLATRASAQGKLDVIKLLLGS
ncbi:hypothetical protein ELG88_18000 [Rhizobium leguminosarum]|uniref:hypothetical protein n=1 Tax=Rhizobium leguminosarum TaxID=384 RepID=UPI001030C963|nr:hypothetical protein [Rhizobium leguminosarum]TBF36979.1 hypothetical protein ELG88_18000 [Rhizobium leguminosarum]